MMEPTGQEHEVRTALLITRVIGFAMCYAGPAVYIFVLGIVVLGGQWEAYFQSWAGVPWQHPVLLALLAAAGMTFVAAFVVPSLLLRGAMSSSTPAITVLRTRSIITFALLEAIAIYGLVLGFVAGASAAPLSLVLMLVPPVGGLALMPREEVWREAATRSSLGLHG